MERGAGFDYSKDLIDGIHPTNTGYKKMAKVWYGALKKVIKKDAKSNKGTLVVPILQMMLLN